jgi:hypothetical protein
VSKTAKTAWCAILAFAVCFIAIALFSPLHKHQNGRCSLNSVEVFAPEEPAVAIEVPAPSMDAPRVAASGEPLRLPETAAVTPLPARAPPAA